MATNHNSEDQELNSQDESQTKLFEKQAIADRVRDDEAQEFAIQETEFLTNEDPDIGRAKYEEPLFLTRGMHETPSSCCSLSSAEASSCCKHHVRNWMADIKPSVSSSRFPIVEVRLKNSRKEFFRLADEDEISEGDIVVVEGGPGYDIGVVSLAGELCRQQMKNKKVNENNSDIKKLYRRAKVSDIEKWEQVIGTENKTLFKTRTIVSDLGLSMKINDVECQGDGSKAIFYYTADERVDFRELIKRLAETFRIRIEMKQIGARQESSRLGGIGTCGRELCCSSWINNFHSVNTASARTQQLSQNPQKLAGQCGKLKCCLNFEHDAYVDQLKEFPRIGVPLHTKKGKAIYHKMDVFRKIMWYAYESTYDLFPLSTDSVKKIMDMNKNNKTPEALEDFKIQQEGNALGKTTDADFRANNISL